MKRIGDIMKIDENLTKNDTTQTDKKKRTPIKIVFAKSENNETKYRSAGLLKRDISATWEMVEKNGSAKAKNVRQRMTKEYKKWLVMIGDTGVYKSVIASCIAKDSIDAGRKVVFGTLKEYIDSINEAEFADRKKFRDKYKTCDLLVIDEVGRNTNTEAFRATIFDILQYREREEKQTILITNLSEHNLWSKYLDVAFQRRIEEQSIIINFHEEV